MFKEAEYWFNKGLSEMKKNKRNKYTLAINCFKKANRISPDKKIYEMLFQCYVRRNTCEFASQIDVYLYNEGMCEIERGNIESAVQYFEESNHFSACGKTYERLYQCHMRINGFEKACECIRKAYILSGNNDKIACEYAQTLIILGQYDKAKRILKKILRRNGTYKPAVRLLDEIGKLNV